MLKIIKQYKKLLFFSFHIPEGYHSPISKEKIKEKNKLDNKTEGEILESSNLKKPISNELKRKKILEGLKKYINKQKAEVQKKHQDNVNSYYNRNYNTNHERMYLNNNGNTIKSSTHIDSSSINKGNIGIDIDNNNNDWIPDNDLGNNYDPNNL